MYNLNYWLVCIIDVELIVTASRTRTGNAFYKNDSCTLDVT